MEYFLVDKGLGYYKDENITIKSFDLLKYRVPVDQIKLLPRLILINLIFYFNPIRLTPDTDKHVSP